MKLKLTKKRIILIASCFLALSMIIVWIHINSLNILKLEGAGFDQNNIAKPTDNIAKDEMTNEIDIQPVDGIRQINVYTVDRELRDVITQYAKEHWDFAYTLNCYTDEMVYSSTDVMNIVADKLVNDPNSIDIYCVPSYAHEFIKGELSDYACTYEELGIDIDAAIEKADIPQYAIDNGSNPEGELIALPFLSTVSVFAYRRSVAKEVWGTDDPSTIAEVIGGGAEKWEDFKKAAMTLKEYGYYIVPGFRDLIYSIDLRNSTGKEISPQWEEFMDVSKYLYDNGCLKDTDAWADGCNKNEKLSVVSGTVLKNADSSREFLGGQNINPIVYEALNQPVGQFYDFNQSIIYLEDAIKAYLWGNKDKATVMEEYKKAVIQNPRHIR